MIIGIPLIDAEEKGGDKPVSTGLIDEGWETLISGLICIGWRDLLVFSRWPPSLTYKYVVLVK